MKKILIAIDDGPASEKIATQGFELGQQLNAEIALISVADTEFLITTSDVTPGQMAHIIKNEHIEKQKKLIDKLFKNMQVSNFVETGIPHEMILKVADEWEADMIVMGTHGRTGLKHLLMGSVAEKVIRHSTKPLYIIPTK